MYSIDGVSLNDPKNRWFTERTSKRRGVPSRRARRMVVPGRNGEVWIPGDDFEAGTVAISLIVQQFDENGSAGGPAQAAENLETILEIVGQNQKLVSVRETLGSYSRKTMAEVSTSIDGSHIGAGLTAYRVPIVMSVPGSFWTDGAVTPNFVAPVVDGTTTITVDTLTGSTAPIRDGVVRITGPVDSQVSIRALARDSNGTVVTVADAVFNWPVTSTQFLYIDLKTFTARLSTSSTAWTSGGTNVDQYLDYDTGGPLQLLPARYSTGSTTREVKIRVVAQGTAASSEIEIRAERTYL